MNEELKKSLNDLIDETLSELEELRKSRFQASEIEIKGPGEGIDGKPSNGKLDAKKADKDEEEDEEEKEVEKKDEDEEDEEDEKEVEKKEVEKKDDDEEEEKEEEKEVEKAEKIVGEPPKMKGPAPKEVKMIAEKSQPEMDTLMKSIVEERVKPLEDKLSTILSLVEKLAEQPVPAKGVTINTPPLMKSDDIVGEELSKAQVANKLFELKKSGTYVDSMDVVKAEMGQDLETIVKRYKIS